MQAVYEFKSLEFSFILVSFEIFIFTPDNVSCPHYQCSPVSNHSTANTWSHVRMKIIFLYFLSLLTYPWIIITSSYSSGREDYSIFINCSNRSSLSIFSLIFFLTGNTDSDYKEEPPPLPWYRSDVKIEFEQNS